MKQFILSILLASLVFFLACNNADSGTGLAGVQDDRDPATGVSNKGNFTEGVDYLLFERVRILDTKGFADGAEAYSMLLPKGWNVESEIIWNGPGSGCDGTNQHIKATSADGKYSIEFFPMKLWGWTSNEQLRDMQQQTASPSAYCDFGQPMTAEEYLRGDFVSQELGGATIRDLKSNQPVADEMALTNDKTRRELMSYGAADVQFRQTAVTASLDFNDNTEGIVLCGMSNIETTIPNVYNGSYDKSYTSQAQQRILFRFPKGQGQQADKMLSVMMSGFRTNPSWRDAVNSFWKDVREKKQVAHIGRIRMMDEQTRRIGEEAIRRGNERLADMDVQMYNWEQKQQSQDRIHSEFIKTIRGVENYQDASGKIELSSGYDHAWSRGDGSGFIMTNNSTFDPSSVFQDQEWKEMKKVD
ncbi:MAG: hypothetical protein EOO05_05105 [Chitinophagaceae bacterium]|nr:MAG: hypothetical protein EOO05_05105 [Chitinophagaceae bacterium]